MTMPTTDLLAAAHRGFFLPIQASEIAREVDPLAWYIYGVTIFFTLLICGVTAYFAWKYRASNYPVADPPGHNNVLEVVWTVIPSMIIFVLIWSALCSSIGTLTDRSTAALPSVVLGSTPNLVG